jgi:prepilin-type N-terminal cleavage/methylation domain-containing protein
MMTPRTRRDRASHAPRQGLTLVELLIVIVMLSIVVGGIMGILVRQQQFYSGAAGVLDTRSSVREGAAVLQSDLRALSPASNDIALMGPTFIEFEQQFGASVVCAVGVNTIDIAPQVVEKGAVLTSWATPPRRGDQVLIYDSNAEGSAFNAQGWTGPTQLTQDPTPNTPCPTSTGLTSTAAEASRGWRLTLQDNVNGPAALSLTGTIRPGSAVRFLRRARYQLYQAADDNWYLGFTYCTPTCGALEAVSGPYLDDKTAAPGVQFRYLDRFRNVTTNQLQVSRIDVTLRARSERAVNMPGRQRGFYYDSLTTSIAVRN